MWRRTRPVETPRRQALANDLAILEQVGRYPADLQLGRPTPCPDCGRIGVIDGVADGIQRNHCRRCRTRWAFSAKALALYQHVQEDQTHTVIGGGVLAAQGFGEGWHRVTRERHVSMASVMR